jgi:large subunit ribosomal protein L4
VLIVSHQPDAFLERSARNLPGVSVVRAEGLNVYDVLRHAKLLLTREAVAKVQGRLAVAGREEAS